MKIAHIADTHFGKDLKKINFADQDQRFWMDKFLEDIDKEDVDAVVIAGDIYDDKIPPLNAVSLFNEFLEKLNQRNIPVLIVAGNHDQATRLADKSAILRKQGIYIAGQLNKELEKVTLSLNGLGDENVNFYLMPYVMPSSANNVLGREDISNYHLAVKELLAVQDINKAEINVIIAHQNVLCGAEERILNDNEKSKGFSGEVDVTAFDGFDYVALGHIHGMQKIGKDTIRYAGAPLQYDFSEEGRWKGYLLVDIKSKDDISVYEKPLPLLHKLVVFPKDAAAATLAELLDIGNNLSEEEKVSTFFKVRIWASSLSSNAKEQLDSAFGDNLLDIEPIRQSSSFSIKNGGGDVNNSLMENFSLFYESIKGEAPNALEQFVAEKIIEQQQNDGFLDTRKGKEKDDFKKISSKDLIDTLEKELMHETE